MTPYCCACLTTDPVPVSFNSEPEELIWWFCINTMDARLFHVGLNGSGKAEKKYYVVTSKVFDYVPKEDGFLLCPSCFVSMVKGAPMKRCDGKQNRNGKWIKNVI